MSLRTVQKFFPNVTTVHDARSHIQVEVTKADDKTSKKHRHVECAMAVACKRKFKADGVIIARSIAYLIRGKTAIRFGVPTSVEREVTSFDRGAGFDPGIYSLTRPPHKMGQKGGNKNKTGKGKSIAYKHVTTGIRAVLGGKDAKV